MKKGDKFYQIVQPLIQFILSGERVGLEEGEYVPIDGKQRKIGEWYPEEHIAEEIYPEENVVMDDEYAEFKIDDVIWDYAEAEKYAAKLNAEEARDGRNNKAVKGIV